jgi:hypothetical protein
MYKEVKFVSFLFIFFFICLTVSGQTPSSRLVYAFLGLKYPDYIIPEARTVEKRMISELVRLGVSENFSLITPRNREILLQNIQVGAPAASKVSAPFTPGALPSARSMIIGQLSRSEQIYRLQLEILRTENLAITNAVQKNFPGLEPLLEDIPPMLRALFDLPELSVLHAPVPPVLAADDPDPEPKAPLYEPSLDDIAGSWKGDNGLESIRIDRNGTGLGHMGGWNLILLAVYIENGRIIVKQDEPNSPKLYMNNFPYSLAVKIAEIARPIQWTFTLSEDKNSLQGIEESTSFHIDQGEILFWDDTHTRPVIWVRQ